MEDEPTILNHYNLTTLYPTEWPAEKDESDASDEELSPQKKSDLRRSKSRYSALERKGSDRRSLVPGSQRTGNGVENLVQKDEADPLGGTDSVVRVLREKGIPVEEDARLRNRFLLSSTTFSPGLYLSQVHANASTQSLLQGLDFLSHSIDQKSASLKLLVESNFERFVRAKTTIDNVYAEMRNQGVEPEPEKPKAHSRIGSRSSTHFRSPSGQTPLSPNRGIHKPLPSDKKKHALAKDSEYGTQGIKAPLIEVAVKAEEIWGPALGGREREESLKQAMGSVENSRDIIETSTMIADCIKRKDYDKLIEEYTKARKYVDDARKVTESASDSQASLTDGQVYQLVITGRMWTDVEDRIDRFKRDIWKKLTNIQAYATSTSRRNLNDDYMSFISILLELGVEDSPIWVWLFSRYDHLRNKISQTFERSRVEIEILRRRLANGDKPATSITVTHLKSPSRQGQGTKLQPLDTPQVIELWELVHAAISNMFSLPGGVLGEVLEFWDKAQSFIDGKAQRTLPNGIDGTSRRHHRLSLDGVGILRAGVIELIDMLRENVNSFFADPPIEDVSLLFSPITPNTPKSALLSPYDSRFQFDANNPPPPSPKRGESWEDFAFWPPYANSLSGVHYLGKLLRLIGIAASEMSALEPINSGSSASEKLKSLVAMARERCARAACAAWNFDADNCKYLEDWTRSNDKRDITQVPSQFESYEMAVLQGMQKILYIPDASTAKSSNAGMITPPPPKLLQMVRDQYIASLYKVLSGMVQNAESSDDGSGGITRGITGGDLTSMDGTTVAHSRPIRLLLTLSNLRQLTTTFPALTSHFENLFSLTLTSETPKVRDVLSQLDARLFSAYTAPTAAKLTSIISTGISSPTWTPSKPRPTEVRPYVYEALLAVVYIHTEVSTTTPPLTHPIIAFLNETLSHAFLAAFSQKPRYPLPALMQATIDIEFVAQTLQQYTSDQGVSVQSSTYELLDKRTDEAARTRLQRELSEMKGILKRLREGTRGEFGCFRRVRGQPPAQPQAR